LNVRITPILMGTWQAGKKPWVGVEDTDSISHRSSIWS